MQRSKTFSLFMISNVPYLLPFGQAIADFKRGVRINDTGAFLWNLLAEDRTEAEMLSLCAAHYEVSDSRLPRLEADLRQFLRTLEDYGMLERPGSLTDSDAAVHADTANALPAAARAPMPMNAPETPDMAACCRPVQRYLSIGGLTILLCGPDKAFAQDFDAFEIFPAAHVRRADAGTKASPHADGAGTAVNSALTADQTVTVAVHAPDPQPESRILLKNPELVVMENDLQYTFLFPNAPGILEAHLTRDGAEARYYCRPPYTEGFRQDLFHAIRLSFLYLAQLHDMVVLHSASLLYRGKAWLFSGHSGAGKSTHTNLWKELYNVPLINGDLNLLAMENGHPMVHGLPWCGTSGIRDTHSHPLGGIILIKKAPENNAVSLEYSDAQLLAAQRLISPGWTEAMLRKNLRLVAELAPHILICRLCCTRTPEAAKAGKQAIDDYLAALTP